MSEPWESLKVGDQVRVTAWPPELTEECLHEETRTIYKWLIETGTVVTVSEIDSWDLPYVEFRAIIRGIEEWHYLAMNHGGLEIVRTEKQANDE